MRLNVNMTDPSKGEIVSFSRASVDISREGCRGASGAARGSASRGPGAAVGSRMRICAFLMSHGVVRFKVRSKYAFVLSPIERSSGVMQISREVSSKSGGGAACLDSVNAEVLVIPTV